ncbi:hypothetical protein [Effusibacillus consociatus]|uniref:Lipoprotein n=1 Tax=Effusibacillus consociatus TaxID=1117041 RepID=A0ABV9Q8J7_9BACL
MKKNLVIPVVVSMLALTGCGQNADQSPINTSKTVLQQNQQTQGGIGSSPRDDAPVSERDKNNLRFKDNLRPPTAFPGSSASAEEVWKWVKQQELTYIQGMLNQQESFSEQQKVELDKWLSDFYGDEWKSKRLSRALKPVEGGYRITNDAYDFVPNDFMIQSVDKLALQKSNTNRMVLTVDLTVKQDQKVHVVYTIGQEQGKWKIIDYSFKLVQ